MLFSNVADAFCNDCFMSGTACNDELSASTSFGLISPRARFADMRITSLILDNDARSLSRKIVSQYNASTASNRSSIFDLTHNGRNTHFCRSLSPIGVHVLLITSRKVVPRLRLCDSTSSSVFAVFASISMYTSDS